jgi:rubrerythrin
MIDPFYRKERQLQRLALTRLKERKRELQAQIKKNPHKSHSRLSAARTRKAGEILKRSVTLYSQAEAAQKRGDEIKARRLGKQALALQRRFYASGAGSDSKWPGGTHVEGPVGRLPNPLSQHVRALTKMEQPEKKRFRKGVNLPYRCEECGELFKENDLIYNWPIVHIAVHRKHINRANPKREAKTSKDAFGVAHENPSTPLDMLALESIHYVNTGKGAQFLKSAIAKAERYRDSLPVKERPKVTKLIILARRELRKKNPSVAAIAEKFQGDTNGAIEQFHAASSAPANLARAGKLVFLKVGAQTFRLPGAMVAIAPNEKLWIVSKRAPVFTTKAKPGEGLDVGEITQICYETAKRHVGNGKTFEYVHEFGEDGGKRPHLIIDHEGMPILRGGDYKIRAEGIVD